MRNFDLVAGEEVTNLQNLKVGDVVALRYLQLLDLELLKGTAGVRKRVVEVEGSKAAAGELRRLPIAAFPAIAPAALAGQQARGREMSELEKKARLTWSVATGRI